ncbi:MAG: polyphosphate kinase 2 family protein, partial [Acidobacteria bacterium]|nr:polyphosphate kinase 2 family protein [Acidobacteriota bacterium]
EEARALLEKNRSRMHLMQEKLYAQDSWGLLIILQAMDAAGKDSLIEHVMSGVNPQGCEVHSFKRPSDEELDHDFLWRTTRRLPERGRIGIFNRSYYEEMLVVRVHPEFLARQRLPAAVVTKNIWRDRAEDINAFERYLTRNGIAVLKFFLYVSREEQRRRFLARIEEPEKNWKFAPADVEERGFWDDYMRAYNDAIKRTSTSDAPWYVVPADQKWFSRLLVSEVIVERLEDMKLAFPRLDRKRRAELRRSRQQLLED